MELNRINRENGSYERVTLEKARRLVFETATNYCSSWQM